MLRTEIAAKLNIGPEALRFYERIGLIPRPARDANGYRSYSTQDLNRLKFVQRAKESGFTLREISGFMRVFDSNRVTRSMIQAALADKMAQIDREIAQLRKTRGFLAELSRSPRLGECGTFRALTGKKRPA